MFNFSRGNVLSYFLKIEGDARTGILSSSNHPTFLHYSSSSLRLWIFLPVHLNGGPLRLNTVSGFAAFIKIKWELSNKLDKSKNFNIL